MIRVTSAGIWWWQLWCNADYFPCSKLHTLGLGDAQLQGEPSVGVGIPGAMCEYL